MISPALALLLASAATPSAPVVSQFDVHVQSSAPDGTVFLDVTARVTGDEEGTGTAKNADGADVTLRSKVAAGDQPGCQFTTIYLDSQKLDAEGKTLKKELKTKVVTCNGQPTTLPSGAPTSRNYLITVTPSPLALAPAGAPPIRKRYTGRRIDLDLKEVDIHRVLRIFSDVGGVNIVTTEGVKGVLTIKMRDVPWDQALDVVLRIKKLRQVRDGDAITVLPDSPS